MNFFEHQDQARRSTTLLIVLFGLAIASMIVAFYGLALMVFGVSSLQTASGVVSGSSRSGWLQPLLLVQVALGTLCFVGLGSAYKTLQLRGGGKVVAQSLGGQRVNLQTENEDLRRLLNVVEEMAIASGVPVPPVYVMTEEPGINAFAAGFTVNDAVIGVTKGCIEQLSRDELQGVIAHEFSHILNGDMRLNLRIIGVLQGILIIYLLGRVLLRGGFYSRGRASGGFFAAGLGLTAIGGIGFVFGRLIKSAVSRQREFLADASAVQFTRNPWGIASALRKIGGFSSGSEVRSPKAEEASHMFFGDMGRSNLADLFATHPPLSVRIQRLESLIQQGAFTPIPDVSSSATPTSRPQSEGAFEGVFEDAFEGALESGAMMGFRGNGAAAPNARSSAKTSIRVAPDRVVQTIGTTDPAHLAYARLFLNQLPTSIRTAFQSQRGARAVIYGLLLDANVADVRDRQLQHLKQTETLDTLNMAQQVSQLVKTLDPRVRLPLVDLTIPALRDLSAQDLARFFKQVQTLVRADGKLSLSEYTLQIVLQRRLQTQASPAAATKVVYTTLTSVWDDCLTLIAGLARVGHNTPDQIAYAFRSGVYRLPGASMQAIPEKPQASSLPAIGQSLQRIAQAAPKVKQACVDACAHTVLVDQEVTLREAELLRAIVIALDCPIPPFLDTPAIAKQPIQKG